MDSTRYTKQGWHFYAFGEGKKKTLLLWKQDFAVYTTEHCDTDLTYKRKTGRSVLSKSITEPAADNILSQKRTKVTATSFKYNETLP